MAKLGLISPEQDSNDISVNFMLVDLARSGLVPSDIDAYPIAPIGFDQVGGYVIPYHDLRMWRIRYDREEAKYIQPKGIRGVWWHPRQTLAQAREQPILYLIEGEKKAAAFVKRWPHLFAFGIGGAHNALESQPDRTKIFLPDIIQAITPGKEIHVILDGDITTKSSIQEAASNIIYAALPHQATAKIWHPPMGKGVDDWLMEDPDAKIEDLIEITPEHLAISRKSLYKQLRLTLNEDSVPHTNESNISVILNNYLTGRVSNDRRAGLLFDNMTMSVDMLENHCLQYIQNMHFHAAKPYQVDRGLNMTLDGLTSDVLQEFVKNLTWDGVPRLDTWGARYFETANPKVASEWGRLLMTGLGMRIIEPGSKVDIVPILIGAQGIGKTTFFQELAAFEGRSYYNALTNFSHDSGDSNRTESIKLANSAILDLGEGIIFDARKTSVELLRERITQTEDTYRPVYSKATITTPRGFIFTGTANRKDLLTDQTGSRRFLMLETTKITRLEYVEKLQILAEVHTKFDELIKSEWWRIKLTMDDILVSPENAHLTNVQEILNSEFKREDTFGEEIVELIECNRVAAYKDGRGYFISLNQLKGQLGDDYLGAEVIVNRLGRLAASVTYKYRVIRERAKPRASQLDFPPGTQNLYMMSIKGEGQMLTGWAILHRHANILES